MSGRKEAAARYVDWAANDLLGDFAGAEGADATIKYRRSEEGMGYADPGRLRIKDFPHQLHPL